jgi:Uma2 family endonuclease
MQPGIAFKTLAPHELAERWRALLVDPTAPDRCEIDAYGEVIPMNPPSRLHQRIVRAIQQQIEQQLGGEALPGMGVVTNVGVRVPDVCWQRNPTQDDPASPAPTICVEVQSEGNSRRELDEKIAGFLDADCEEVILVELSGRIRFFGPESERAQSAFGLKLQLPDGTYPR